MPAKPFPGPHRLRRPLRWLSREGVFVVGGYLGFAAVWLVVSDKLFAILATTYSERRLLHLFNDAVFVGVALAAMLTVVALHRRRAARELRHTQAQLLTFIRTAPFSIAMFDIEMHALAWSDRWLAEFGGTNADLPDAWREAHARATQGESTRRDEDPWRRSEPKAKSLNSCSRRAASAPFLASPKARRILIASSPNSFTPNMATKRRILRIGFFTICAGRSRPISKSSASGSRSQRRFLATSPARAAASLGFISGISSRMKSARRWTHGRANSMPS